MPSIFDTLFGTTAPGGLITQAATGSGSILDLLKPPTSTDPLDPAVMRRHQWTDGLAGLSQGLLAAGGPSLMPTDFGSALGKGLSGALTARDSGEDRYLKRALVSSQVATARDKMERQRAVTKSILDASGPDPADSVSSVTPPVGAPTPLMSGAGGGGPSNPSNPGNLADGKGGFQTFKSPEEGVAAAIKLAQEFPKRYNGGQPMTLAQVESHWAPPDDGKDPMTRGNKAGVWSGNVARVMGIDPNTPIDFSNPQVGFAFARAVHQAEHPAGSGYAPEVYNRGTQLAYGQAPPGVGGPIPPGTIAQPPVQFASAPVGVPPGMPPQGDAGPATGPQMAQVAPQAQASPIPGPPTAGAPAGNTLRQVIRNLSPAERELLARQDPDDVAKFLMTRAAPNHETVLDTVDGTVKFVDKGNREIGTRYQPVKGAELAVAMRNAAASERQAGAAEDRNRIRSANEPLQVGGTPTPGFIEQKGAVSGAEAAAKVGPALLQHQGELVIKDSQGAQVAADHARTGIANLSRLGSLLDQVNTGKYQGTVQDLKASAKAAGVDLNALGVGDNVGVAQAAKALTGQLALGLRDPSGGSGMPGAMSDKDREFLVAMVPAITNDPNGNKLMLEWQKKLYQRNIEVAKIVNDYGRSPEFLKDPTGVYAKVREYAEKNPLFDPEKDMPKAPASGGSLTLPPLNAIDAEIARRKKAAGQ